MEYGKSERAIHVCYHRCMTLYFTGVFERFARRFGYRFESTARAQPSGSSDLLLVHDGQQPSIPEGSRGTHIVRDPRDLVVSGYFYHLRTSESWCALPNEANDDLPSDVSYQQHLRSLSVEDGLLFEMNHVSGAEIDKMAAWDYGRPEFLELRFEDVLGNERSTFERVFDWYGFTPREARAAGRIAVRQSASRVRRLIKRLRGSRHIRWGSRVGQWRDHFTPRVESHFRERFGTVIRDLGYDP